MTNILPKISIIIPIYNASTTLQACIESVLNQDFPHWEVLLIDDGSNDNSYEVCLEFAKKDSRIRVFQQDHQGVSAARNLAISKILGEFTCFIDSDDYIEPNYLNSLYKYKDYDLVICGYYVDFLDRNLNNIGIVKHTPNFVDSNIITDKHELYNLFLNGMMNTNWNKLYKSYIIKDNKIKFKSYPINEDYLFILEYLNYVSSIYTIQEPLYHWIRIKDKNTGVSSMPENLLEIYNEAHLLTRDFFQENAIADDILYFSYQFVALKYLNSLSQGKMSRQSVYAKLKEFHQNTLVQASYQAYKPKSKGDWLMHTLQKMGWYKCYFYLQQFISKWKN